MSKQTEKKIDLLELLPEEVDRLFSEQGLEPYRSVQVVEWLYRQNARSFVEMTNLPIQMREDLGRNFSITDLRPEKVRVSRIDRTKKTLFELNDGATVESVLLPEGRRSTVCVSSQIGCAFGCAFCASGQSGLARNLTAGEIVDQIRWAQFEPDSGRLSNVVFMGMGEPLANYEATARAIRIALHERCFKLGKRRITISTAGYVPGIERLAVDDLPVRVALSLHATDNSTRDSLMPINKTYPIEQVLEACKPLSRKRQMPLTLEYMLIDGINDSISQARELAEICRSLNAKVNLIACNPALSTKFAPPSEEQVLRFQAELRSGGILAFIRPSRGLDIEGACGQLRASHPTHSE